MKSSSNVRRLASREDPERGQPNHPLSTDARHELGARGLAARSAAVTLRTVQRYTRKHGQYLAFIYYYTKIHGNAPSEADMRRYFKMSPPTIHQMILSLEKQRYIERTPGRARSIRLLLTKEHLPDLD